MLRAVAFQNFIKFRDHQSLEFQDGPNFIVGPNASGKSAIFELIRRCLSNTANSSISTVADPDLPAFVICKFEISQELSNKLLKGCHVYSCVYIKHWGDTKDTKDTTDIKDTKEIYKLVCITNKYKQQDTCYLDHYPSFDDDKLLQENEVISFCKDSTELSQELDKLIEAERSRENLNAMIQKMMGAKQQPDMNTESDIIGCEAILQAIHDAVVVTFPIRSPGPIQWSHSRKINQENYAAASTKAEILQDLLQSGDVDEEESTKIFKTIIHPLEYHFKKNPHSTITVDDGAQDIRFLKVPEGVSEAKQFSLMFAHRKYQTLVLEEPGRGMHPHMIQKLRDLVFRKHTKDQGKVLLLTTHQTAMLNQWSMSRMFICRRTRNADGELVHRVINLSEIERIYELEDILKEMVFSESVLFVEGFTDKKVIRSVFDRVLEADGFTDPQMADLQKMAARTQIISIGGSRIDISDTLTRIGKKLEIPCKFLFDRDTMHMSEKAEVQPKHCGKQWKSKASFCARTLFKRTEKYRKENQVQESEDEGNNLEDVMNQLTEKGVRIKDVLGLTNLQKVKTTDIESFIRRVLLPRPLPKQKENVFIWESGNLENVICKSILGDQTEVQQSTESTSNQTDIDVGLLQKMFLCEYYDERKEKDPVKETLKQMDIETAEALSACLLKRGEMMTFLKFLSDNEKPNPGRTN